MTSSPKPDPTTATGPRSRSSSMSSGTSASTETRSPRPLAERNDAFLGRPMSMDAARFRQGRSYDEFKARMTRNREAIEASERAVRLDPADVSFLRGLPRPLNVVVIAEDWCADVVANLPVLMAVANASGKMEVRIFEKGEHPELMVRYRNQGKFESLPVFVFFDEAFHEVGVFIERPASVTARGA